MTGGLGGRTGDGGMAFVPTKRGRRTSAPAVLDNIDENSSQMKLVDFSPEASAMALAPIKDLTEGEGGLVEQNVKYSMVYDSFKDQQVADYALKDYARYFLTSSRCAYLDGSMHNFPARGPSRDCKTLPISRYRDCDSIYGMSVAWSRDRSTPAFDQQSHHFGRTVILILIVGLDTNLSRSLITCRLRIAPTTQAPKL